MSTKKATLCFVKWNNKILMINRANSPFMGMWNAVGGKVLDGESVENCAIREVFEESGITVSNPIVFSEFTWNYDDEIGYAVLFNLPDQAQFESFCHVTQEGIVVFKDVEWIVSDKNYGVIDDLKVFIQDIKLGRFRNYHLIYDNKSLKEVIVK